MKYDLLVKGGFLIDPAQGIEGYRDLALLGGKVALIHEDIDPKSAREVVDASGKIVTPGLIDLHVHVYWGATPWGVDADLTCLAEGVTTAVDAGSSGSLTFSGFRRYIIDASNTRLFAFLHISSIGLTPRIGELLDLRNLDFNAAVETAKNNKNLILGIKIRLGEEIVGQHGPQVLRLAKEATKSFGAPIMVHPGRLPKNLPITDVLDVVEKGDIITHCFPPAYPPLLEHPSIFDEDCEVLPEVRRAKEKGVIFDVGHGMGSFSWETAKRALAQGFLPTTISSDLHVYSVDGPAFDMPTVMSKLLNLGLPLSKVIELSTFAPASVLGMEDRIGTLKLNANGDIAVFELKEGEFTYWDNSTPLRKTMTIRKLLKPVKVIKDGRIVSPVDKRPSWAVLQKIGEGRPYKYA